MEGSRRAASRTNADLGPEARARPDPQSPAGNPSDSPGLGGSRNWTEERTPEFSLTEGVEEEGELARARSRLARDLAENERETHAELKQRLEWATRNGEGLSRRIMELQESLDKERARSKAGSKAGECSARFLGGTGTHEELIKLCAMRRVISVHLCAYSFDVGGIVQSLTNVLAGGGMVHLIVDWSQAMGKTREMLNRLFMLKSKGARVVVCRGKDVRQSYEEQGREEMKVNFGLYGLCHGKSALVRLASGPNDSAPAMTYCLAGSANWSDSTASNVEFGVVLERVGQTFVSEWLSYFEAQTRHGSSLYDVEDALEQASKSRGKGRSKSREPAAVELEPWKGNKGGRGYRNNRTTGGRGRRQHRGVSPVRRRASPPRVVRYLPWHRDGSEACILRGLISFMQILTLAF